MHLRIQPASAPPIYRQIEQQVRYLVAAGRLAPGDELPGIRALAEQLVINPNTVARAYLELERAGVIVKRHGAGTYVADRPPAASRGWRESALAERADALLTEAAQMGWDFDAVVDLLRRRRARMTEAGK